MTQCGSFLGVGGGEAEVTNSWSPCKTQPLCLHTCRPESGGRLVGVGGGLCGRRGHSVWSDNDAQKEVVKNLQRSRPPQAASGLHGTEELMMGAGG